MTSKSVFIRELVADGDRWRMSIGEVGSADALWREMYPTGTSPYGFTINEELVQTEPDLIGHFFIGGVTEQAVQTMEQGFGQAFREAGFRDGAAPGYVRTWFRGSELPTDLPESEFRELYCDNFTSVGSPTLSTMTIYDLLVDQTLVFNYGSGATYDLKVSDIGLNVWVTETFENRGYVLVVPVDENWVPQLNQYTTPRMAGLRVALEDADRSYRAQQLAIGEMIGRFAEIIAQYSQLG